jgi:hypothetical protein
VMAAVMAAITPVLGSEAVITELALGKNLPPSSDRRASRSAFRT